MNTGFADPCLTTWLPRRNEIRGILYQSSWRCLPRSLTTSNVKTHSQILQQQIIADTYDAILKGHSERISCNTDSVRNRDKRMQGAVYGMQLAVGVFEDVSTAFRYPPCGAIETPLDMTR